MSEQQTNTEKVNAIAKKQQEEKIAKIMATPFYNLPSKQWEIKLDNFYNQTQQNNQQIESEFQKQEKTIQGFSKKFRELTYAMNFLTDKLSNNNIFHSKEEYVKEFQAYVDKQRGLRVLSENDVVQPSDELTVNFTGFVDGKPQGNMSVVNATFILNYQNYVPDLENGFLGMKAGQKKMIPVTFPKDYQAEKLAGKTFDFELELLAAKRNVQLEQTIRQNYLDAIKKLGFDTNDYETMPVTDLGNELVALRNSLQAKALVEENKVSESSQA